MQVKFTEKQLEKTLVLQHDQSDCGVACLLSLIRFYQGDHSLEKLRELSGTTKQGTTLLGLYQSANQLGFTAQGCEADIQALIDHPSPVILHVTIDNRLQHYVVCYGTRDNKFIIGDPAKGILYYTKDELENIWKSKTCLTLEPNTSFVKQEQHKTAKKAWFIRLLKEDYNLLAFSAVLGLLTAILGMVMAVFSQKLIDDILPTKDYTKLITGIALVTFLLLVKSGFTVLRSYFLLRQSKDFNNRIINDFYGALLQLPKPFFDTRKIGELVSRLNDTQRVQEVIQLVANNFVVNILVSIVSLGFLFYYSWQVGLIASVSLPLYFILIYSFNTKIINSQKEVMQSRANSQSNYISTMNGIATIKNNNKQTLFQKLNKLIYGHYQDCVFDLGKIHIRLSLFSNAFSVFFLIAILSYTTLSVYYNTLQIGELMAILGVAGSLLPSVANIALIAIPLNEAKVAFNRMYEFASIEKEKDGNIHLHNFESLSIQDVRFRFAGRSPLFQNISLKISKGECIAIVGESGSGKSTLGQIIQKFYHPEHGDIVINDTYSLDQIRLDSWRNIIGVIEQDIEIFNGTVLDNIILGNEDTPENIIKFCEAYGLDIYIAQFPQGYTTILGEDGINLSGGQKQIIALARVLYKKPQLLILDEYTSAMDRKTEQFSLKLLQDIKDKIGIIFISHRLHSLPKIADQICVIENGQTSISGTHQELLRSENFYSDFWNELHKNISLQSLY
ncbi:peptidase domain-containing ABC transporter [uncultured Aquimarina sp.]|uniref:peptidase domain-containing ABC transporter n=1 Tax=uncultured Aquimarina sp. TaxID=575652 RepID=UPI002635B3EA|nr:peptidase domain-containing ABC transporter [uncultured Aquimarina sp.]